VAPWVAGDYQRCSMLC